MSPQERKIDWCNSNQLNMTHISASLNPEPSLIPHHIGGWAQVASSVPSLELPGARWGGECDDGAQALTALKGGGNALALWVRSAGF